MVITISRCTSKSKVAFENCKWKWHFPRSHFWKMSACKKVKRRPRVQSYYDHWSSCRQWSSMNSIQRAPPTTISTEHLHLWAISTTLCPYSSWWLFPFGFLDHARLGFFLFGAHLEWSACEIIWKLRALSHVLFFSLWQIFPANYDRFIVVCNRLLRPVKARYFRIYPVTWRSWISMRVEFYGCIAGKFFLRYARLHTIHVLRQSARSTNLRRALTSCQNLSDGMFNSQM